MVSRVTLKTILLAFTTWSNLDLCQAGSDSGYMQKLKHLTWDMGLMHEYPMEWATTGTAVPILSKTMIVPSIPKVNGQIFLK